MGAKAKRKKGEDTPLPQGEVKNADVPSHSTQIEGRLWGRVAKD